MKPENVLLIRKRVHAAKLGCEEVLEHLENGNHGRAEDLFEQLRTLLDGARGLFDEKAPWHLEIDELRKRIEALRPAVASEGDPEGQRALELQYLEGLLDGRLERDR
jgi:hypothetical protein